MKAPSRLIKRISFPRPAIEGAVVSFLEGTKEIAWLVYMGIQEREKPLLSKKCLPIRKAAELIIFLLARLRMRQEPNGGRKYLPHADQSIEAPEVVASRIERHLREATHDEIMVLDDVQWVDEFSRRLIGSICELGHIGN